MYFCCVSGSRKDYVFGRELQSDKVYSIAFWYHCSQLEFAIHDLENTSIPWRPCFFSEVGEQIVDLSFREPITSRRSQLCPSIACLRRPSSRVPS